MTNPASSSAPIELRASVICVVRNQNENLHRALEALRESTIASETEIIVVDLASNDGSHILNEAFPEVTYLRLPKNFGWTKAANIGLRTARTETILFLDPRVVLAPDAVALLLSAVEESGPVAATVPTLFTPEGLPAPVLRALPTPAEMNSPAKAPSDVQESAPVEYPGALALMIRKSFLKGMNFLDHRYGEQWADAEIAIQVKRAQRKILRISSAKGVLHPESPKGIPVAQLEADWYTGAGVYLSKHFGGSMGYSVQAALRAGLSGKFGVFTMLLSGFKIDGSQG